MLVWASVPSSFGTVNVPTADRPVTIAELDATFVAALGLAPAARTVQRRLAVLGYAPRSDAGTEVVARLLGLRYNHPAGQDRLERSDTEAATRADAAWTTAKILNGVSTDYARMVVAKFARLPRTTGQRHAALARAVRQIGMPYVWGGTTEGRQPQGHGGFDCSGLAWRVMILDPAAPKGMLKKVGGRTTYQMAHTTKRSRRLSRARMRPGDIILYRPAGPAHPLVVDRPHRHQHGRRSDDPLLVAGRDDQGVGLGLARPGVRVRQVRAAALRPVRQEARRRGRSPRPCCASSSTARIARPRSGRSASAASSSWWRRPRTRRSCGSTRSSPDADETGALADAFAWHPLVREDITHGGQRQKAEQFPGHVLAVLRLPRAGAARAEDLYLVQAEHVLVTVHSMPDDWLDRRSVEVAARRALAVHGAAGAVATILDAVAEPTRCRSTRSRSSSSARACTPAVR